MDNEEVTQLTEGRVTSYIEKLESRLKEYQLLLETIIEHKHNTSRNMARRAEDLN